MLVKVIDETRSSVFIDNKLVGTNDEIRRAAFIFVYRRPPKDYNEMVHNVSIVEPIELPNIVAKTLLGYVG